jgi:hypothetical protein
MQEYNRRSKHNMQHIECHSVVFSGSTATTPNKAAVVVAALAFVGKN